MRQAVNPISSQSADSGFTAAREPTEPESSTQSAAGPKRLGRRPLHSEPWTKVTVVLLDREIVFLDRLLADIRAASGEAISRAHLIRALIDALAESDLDLTACRSERDLNKVFVERLCSPAAATEHAVPRGQRR
jgi:hypothetical protein